MILKLKRIRSIWKFITHDACKHLIRSAIFLPLNWYNSLLLSTSEENIRNLQDIQNYATCPKFKKQRQYRVIASPNHTVTNSWRLEFNCLHGKAPSYLQEMKKIIQIYTPPQALRSSSDNRILFQSKVKRKSGQRSFLYIGPKILNLLPFEWRLFSSLGTFKKILLKKTTTYYSIYITEHIDLIN